jgi:hypothetical protein
MPITKWIRGAAVAGLAILACACGNTTQPAGQQAQESAATFQDFGNYEVHFNALRTDALTADVARTYGIQRSTNRVMLNVTILHKEAEHAARKPVDGTVQVDAYNLNGQLKNIQMRRVAEGEAIYYIGEVSIGGTEILVFDITVTPTGENTPLKMKFQREFFSG